MRKGEWPPHPDISNYTDPMIQTGYRTDAYFTKPAEILGEVMSRIERAGIHGKLLVAEIEAGRLELSYEANEALMYVKGWRRKFLSFERWKAQRRYRQKT